MPDSSPTEGRLLPPASVAEALSVSVDEVVALIMDGRLRGLRVGSGRQWRVEEASVAEYLDDEAEEARRMALWRQSSTASFPELWGRGRVRNPD
ncbi:excisionase family DNA-binding protein [Microbacterium sp. cx-55]|uniref:excisionase family DNA-binding protein n=1 Tax=unclassified Microbacterium TaxID=2609290 RepID=UPI001CBFBCB0|nr:MULTISPECIES: excisionase family DNA-binding protein [unclassified Microbacterium]MBZ4488723.1 excisionase family DNA-binding protein [Microbacterium sp. cx-55]MCC4909589.1 excisionase family DNA-binding protein [Microbacterium sp. cx-59]UGB36039.1 excisionase family DNA-binding protein [Microbacterium sp. cx-55]